MSAQPRLLLIDDDPVSRHALTEVLEGAGFAVTVDAAADHDLVLAHHRVDCRVPQVLLAKPVRAGSLLAAIRDALARDANDDLAIGRWRFDEAARLLEDKDGLRVRLTDKEAAILGHLRRAGGVVAREVLLAEIWGYSAAVTTHTLETHIYRLRRKIEQDPARAELLLTEGGGYRLSLRLSS